MKQLKIVALFILLGITNVLSAKNLPAYITQDTIISEGFFSIDRNISIAKDATLYLNQGVQISLAKGATILVYGGLVVNGTSENPVKIFSTDFDDLGVGIKILDKSETSINIKNVEFDNLKIPFNVSGLWHRNEINVEGCVFRNITTGEPGVIIDNAFPSLEKEIIFNFTKSKFVDNYSNISIGFSESNNIIFNFQDNVITRNFIFGYNDNASLVSAAPLSFKVSDENMRFPINIKGNSIFNNYAVGKNDIYVKLTELNMGFKGSAPAINIESNYFGPDTDIESVRKTILAENTSVNVLNLLDNPSVGTPVHVIGLEYHDKDVYNENNEYVPWMTQNFVDSFSVILSRPVQDAEIEECLYSEVWDVLVSSDLTDGDSQNRLEFASNNQVLNAMCPWSNVDEDEKDVFRYYDLILTTSDGRIENLAIGRIYLDIYLFENTNKFTFEYKKYTMEDYTNFFAIGGGKVEATEDAPYYVELSRLNRKIEVASAVNYYILGDEIKEFKKKWKKTPNYNRKDYNDLRDKLDRRFY